MRQTLFIIILIFSFIIVKAQSSWEFINKIYIVDTLGSIDSVTFGNDSTATLGIDPTFSEQDIISLAWDSLEIRSIHRTSGTDDCPINNWRSDIFETNMDLKIDIRKTSSINTDTNTSFIFKIRAINYPIEVFSNFSEMFDNSLYYTFGQIAKYTSDCGQESWTGCFPDYHHIFTLNDSTERYIAVWLEADLGLDDFTSNKSHILIENPVRDLLKLNYNGRIQIYSLSGILMLDCYLNESEQINVESLKSAIYLIKTSYGITKMLKK